jgi:restriction system protein
MVKQDFPYSYPQYLSPVLQILSDGETHCTEEIRTRILADFPLTPEELEIKRPKYVCTVFVNKVAHAFNRLVLHKAIEGDPPRPAPGAYRITDHGRGILDQHPNDARERDLKGSSPDLVSLPFNLVNG